MIMLIICFVYLLIGMVIGIIVNNAFLNLLIDGDDYPNTFLDHMDAIGWDTHQTVIALELLSTILWPTLVIVMLIYHYK